MIRKDKKQNGNIALIETKIDALMKFYKGQSIKSVAFDLGVGEITVGDRKRNRVKIKKFFVDKTNSNKAKNTMKHWKFEKIFEALFLWFI